MINKLYKKISLIISLAISIPLLIIISLYLFSYYNNMIRTNSLFIDRFNKNNNNIVNVSGVYYITINDNNIVSKSDNITSNIESYALKVYSNNKKEGIINNYIYIKDKKDKNNNINIVLIENEDEINNLKIIYLVVIIITLISLFLIYILSRKLSKLIILPVENTFNKQKDFISDASHELKTPLAVIRANADVLEEDIGNNKWLGYILNETDNMEKLISELLLLTKVENIDMLRSKETFNLSDHTLLIVSSFESMAYDAKIKLVTDIEKDIVTSNFNREDITHILSTLIDNAIKHTNKKVVVSLNKSKDKVVFIVKNIGDEIPISERDKIFERFYRIDKSRNRNEKRYGLGLAICKSIVIKNSGNIEVTYENGYTIFKVELPL